MKKSILAIIIFLAIGIISVLVFWVLSNRDNRITERLDTNVSLERGAAQGEKKERPNSKISTNDTIAYDAYSTCLENTTDERYAKDCCDCLPADELTRKACRDATVSYAFKENITIKEFVIPSVMGKDGDYSAFTVSGNEQECKRACEDESSGLVCGDYQYCRTACNNLSK